MNLLKKYTPHEMMEMTIRDIKRRQLKREKDYLKNVLYKKEK